MATGDQTDIEARLRQLIPVSWFPFGATPLYDGLIAGLAAVLAPIYSLLAYIRQQTRIGSATDGFLELIAGDYLGDGLPRNGRNDTSYRAAIKAAIVRERGTRPAVIKVLEDLTGRTPTIFEPRRPADTGAYGGPTLGYGVAGRYGSRSLKRQAFVTAYRPLGTGIPNVAGYGVSVAGYSVGSQSEYASLAMIGESLQDADIYAAVDSVRPICGTLWVRIES